MNRNAVLRGALAATFAVMLSTGCPNPITNQTFLQMTDKNPPTVDISSPAGSTPYTQTVTVQGTALDAEGRIKGIAWTVTGVLGLLEEGTIPASGIGTDGSFSFQFGTLAYSGPIAVNVKATDWNDNVGTRTVTLTEPNSQLSSFTVEPGNKKVTLDWEEVSGATYTVYYTTNGTLPSGSNGTQVSVIAPPYEVTGLINGAMHVFLLKAAVGGQDYWSGYVNAIPLSPFTLAPLVRGEYRRISLEWDDIAATDEFEVFRSTSPTGGWANLTGIIRATSYVDTAVNDNTWYYYEIRPSLEGSVMSTFNGAEPLQIAPDAASAITGINLPSPANRVKVYGNYAFIADGASGLVVVNVQDPRHPFIVGTPFGMTDARDIELNPAGTIAYIADGDGGLRIVDISTPASPALLGTQPIASAETFAVSVIQDASTVRAYVLVKADADSHVWLRVINVTTPSSPSLLTYGYDSTLNGYGFTDLAATWYASSLRNIYCASGSTSNGEFVKVRDTLAAFSFRGAYNDPTADPLNSFRSHYLYVKTPSASSDYVYSIGLAKGMIEPPPGYVLRIFNQTSDNPPSVVGTSAPSQGDVRDVTLRGTKVYAADGIGVQVFDVSVPASPTFGAFWNTPGTPYGIDVDAGGTTAFAASGTLGLHSVDLSTPLSPQAKSKYTTNANYTYDVAIRGQMAVAAISNPGVGLQRLQLLNVSNPAAPAPLGSLGLTWPGAVALSGDYAFVLDNGGLEVIDISNTSLPVLRGTATPTASMERITVRGDYAYVAGAGFQIYDISDPTHPFAVGFFDSGGGGVHDVELRGSNAYISDGTMFQSNNCLKILDISNPANPFEVGRSATSAITPDSVCLYGDYAFMSDSMPGQGVWAVNIDPQSAQFLTAYGPCDTAMGGTVGNSNGVAAYGPWAFALDSSEGLAVVDISDPTALADASLKMNYDSGTYPMASPKEIFLSGKYAYIADQSGTSGGLIIIELVP